MTLPSGAVITVDTDGVYTYDPNGQFESLDDGETGIDKFNYTISDGNGETDKAIVTIFIDGKTPPPCDIEVIKTCEVVTTSEQAMETCSNLKEVTKLTMIWNGTSGVNITTALDEIIPNVNQGDVVEFNATTAAMGNDFEIYLTGSVTVPPCSTYPAPMKT